MSLSSPPDVVPDAAPPEPDAPASPRSDFIAAFGWMALGVAILIGSWTMDRLENQDVNPYTVPGLLPGLLGIVMMLLGATLAVRSWRQGALRLPAGGTVLAGSAPRIWLAIGLCAAFDIVLVGHGLPFWIAAALFVTTAILSLQHPQRTAAGVGLTVRAFLVAAVIGLGAGGIITLVFQQIFLVRLP